MSRVMHPRALRVFAEHVAQSRRATPEIDELCREHPDLEDSLRQLARERSESKGQAPSVASPTGKGLTRARMRYVLLGEVARGGMGVVLHVWDVVLERPLAMKVLDTKALAKAGGDAEEALARFLAEARIAGQLQHPSIVPIHDLGSDARGRMYFTMALCEGCTLDEVFDLARDGAEGWTLPRAVLVLAQACDVVAHAHARGVIHRDLKPANLITCPSGETYIVDWGLAKVLETSELAAGSNRTTATGNGAKKPEARKDQTRKDEPDRDREDEAKSSPAKKDGSSKSRSREDAGDAGREADAAEPGSGPGQTLDGTVAGTPPYMAPEQALGDLDEVSYAADVYALGAILYRLIAGRPPYAPRQGSEEPQRTVELIRRGPPTPLSIAAPEAPEELVAIVERAMARRPEDRHASIQDLARELRAFAEPRLDEGQRR